MDEFVDAWRYLKGERKKPRQGRHQNWRVKGMKP
jgi:hypothetical protein